MGQQRSATEPFLAPGILAKALAWIGALFRAWFGKPPEPEPVPEPEPEPEPDVESLDAFFGNIRLLTAEKNGPPPDLPNRHAFPQRLPPTTRFEEFNWRLLIHEPKQTGFDWPATKVSDFATVISGLPATVLTAVHLRLRPYYPVIYDPGGAWAWASRQLEMDPDYTDQVVDAYLAVPAWKRPVVVSVNTGRPATYTDKLIFLRYGFEDYAMSFQTMAPYIKDSLASLMNALTGSSRNWLWFSVARMRKSVIDSNRMLESLRAFLEKEAEAQQQDDQRNRFAALWGLRSIAPPAIPADPEPAPADLESEIAIALTDTVHDTVKPEPEAATP